MKSQVLTYLLLLSWGFCSAQSDWNKGDNSPVIINKNKHIVTLLGFEPTDIIRSSEGANISLNCISENNKIEINYLNDNFVITVCSTTISIKDDGLKNFKLFLNGVSKTFNYVDTPNSDPNPNSVDGVKTDLYVLNIFRDAESLSNGQNAEIIKKAYSIDKNSIIVKEIDSLIGRSGAESADSKATKWLSGLGNTEITSLADGFAKFLVTRVKKELSIAFFDRFKDAINDEKAIDFHILFPETKGQLELIDEKVYELKPYLNGLRMSSIADFKTMPVHLPELLTEETLLKKALETNIEAKYGVSIAFGLIKEIDQNENFGVALENLSQYKIPEVSSVEELDKYVEIIRLLSFALKSPAAKDDKYYISPADIDELINNEQLLKYFVGLTLAYTNLESIQPVNISKSIIEDVKAFYQNHTNDLIKVLKEYRKASDLFVESQKTEEKETKLILYFQAAEKILNSTKTVSNVIFPSNPHIPKFIERIDLGVNIASSLYTKNYVSTIGGIGKLYKMISEEHNSNDKKDLDKVISKITTYANFIAQISQTDDSEEISTIIEQYAAPVGSYRSKSLNKFTVAIDSYVGAGYRFGSNSGGLMINTPIGVSLGFSNGTGKWSFTVMPTIFDIGPLVSYRFTNDDDAPAKIYFKEIISPGIFASIGFSKKCPIFLNLGYQRPALLTRVDAIENTYDLKPIDYLSGSLS
ncbi:MAG TPA: hypothetical protein PK209_13600, partial [Saprospiraceae bacterium]|nr:hypothetical protein [Saprospiraceae bacterium]